MDFDPAVAATMLVLGVQLGFVGIGGGAFITGVLIVGFGVPVHLAFGTGLGAVFVTSAVGGWSHLREGNVDPMAGIQIGLAGLVGAYVGGGLALASGATELRTISGLLLWANAVVLYYRSRVATHYVRPQKSMSLLQRWWRELPGAALLGLSCGTVSGFFSIGGIPWIQVGLMVLRGMDLRTTIGTAMFSLAFTSLGGAVRFAQGGQFSLGLLASVLLGASVGTFAGAKFTKRAPRWLVRAALVATPICAGSLLILPSFF